MSRIIMKINKLITYLSEKKQFEQIVGSDRRISITGLTQDSRSCNAERNLYIAIKGISADGHNFINQAICNGAKIIVCEKAPEILSSDVCCLIVKNTKICARYTAELFYDFPQNKLKLIGITGTNGKTSTAFILRSLFNEYGLKTGLLGTVEYDLGNESFIPTHTTPDIFSLYFYLSKMVLYKCRYCVMEVSSHALDQSRIEGLLFDYTIFTSFSQDHLDYHLTMDKYLEAKLLLFTKYSKKTCVALINSDLKETELILNSIKSAGLDFFTYGQVKADYKIDSITSRQNGLEVSINNFVIEINLSGEYQGYNFTAGISLLSLILGKEIKGLKSKFRQLNIPGRMEKVGPAFRNIFLDYAHTPDALEVAITSLQSLKNETSGRIVTLFGCGGNRDKAKRPIMGRIASNLSDYCVLTTDNPRNEDPLEIIKDIKSGINKDNYKVIANRKEAITETILSSSQNDIILIAGKGHEEYQEIMGEKIDFSDKEIVNNLEIF